MKNISDGKLVLRQRKEITDYATPLSCLTMHVRYLQETSCTKKASKTTHLCLRPIIYVLSLEKLYCSFPANSPPDDMWYNVPKFQWTSCSDSFFSSNAVNNGHYLK